MQTLADTWAGFKAEVLNGIDLPENAEIMIRDAFYSGAFSCFHLFTQSGETEAQAVDTLRILDKELNDFLNEKVNAMTMGILKGENQDVH